MAIEQFAEGLLQRQRSRIKEQEDRVLKDQRRAQQIELIGAGVQIANKALQQKAQDFLNSEAAYAERVNYQKSLKNASNTIDQYDEAAKHMGGVEGWLTNQRETYLAAELAKSPDALNYNQSDIQSYIRDEARTWAKDNVSNFESSYNSALQMGTMEEFIDLQKQGYSGPMNVGSWLGDKVSGFFTGKSNASVRGANANRIRERLTQAGSNAQVFDAAFEAGWSTGWAEKLDNAIASGSIRKAQLVELGREEGERTFKRGTGSLTIDGTWVTSKKPNGFTQKVFEPNKDDPNYKAYMDSVQGKAYSIVADTPVITKDPTFGYTIKTTNSTVYDAFQNEIDKVISIEYDYASGQAAVLAKQVDDSQRGQVRNGMSDIASVRSAANPEDPERTMSGIFGAYQTQALNGQEPSAEVIKQRQEDLETTIAIHAREAVNSFIPAEFENGAGRRRILNSDFTDLAKLAAIENFQSMHSMEVTPGIYTADKGFQISPTNNSDFALGMLTSYIQLENTESQQVALEPETIIGMIANVNFQETSKLDKDRMSNLVYRVIGTSTTDELFTNPETGAPGKIARTFQGLDEGYVSTVEDFIKYLGNQSGVLAARKIEEELKNPLNMRHSSMTANAMSRANPLR